MGLRTEHFQVGYGKRIVVDDITLTVKPGEILTLIGPNGSGKSTILKSITKQLKGLGGAVFIGNTDMRDMSEGELAKELSMVMTERIKPEFMTCREVVATGRYPYTGRFGILSKEDWQQVDYAMEFIHATEVAEQNFLQISDGQKQRVMLARAICQDTKILILDEPTSYLDMRYKLDILSNIRNMARDKKLAVIMSLHELDLAQKISDTIACVDGDHISLVGTPEEVFAGNTIQRLYHIADQSFCPRLGTMYLPANKKEPEIFVISGGGSGISTFQRLQRENIPFAVGILAENDLEYSVASSMASKVVSTKAFYPIREAEIMEAKHLIDQCDRCICSLTEFGPFNKENEILLEYALQQKKCYSV